MAVSIGNSEISRYDVLAFGLLSVCAQSIFIREMLSLFSGTEFIIGVLIASWLFWVGVGGAFGGRIFKGLLVRSFSKFRILIITVSLFVPLTTILIRLARGYIVSSPGELPPFVPSLAICFAAMGPVAFSVGLIYGAASRWWKEKAGSISAGVSWVYIYEAAGSVAGGLLLSLALLRIFTQFQASFLTAALVILVVSHPYEDRRKAVWGVLIVSASVLFMLFLAQRIDLLSVGRLFPGFEVEKHGSSKYGEIAAVSKEGAVSYFSGGDRVMTIPDRYAAEESIHIPLLAHPEPVSILVIGGGLGEEIREAVKHPSVERIDCVQLDATLLELVSDVTGNQAIRPLEADDLKLNIIIEDGRRYLKGTAKKYDLIIVNAPDPLNLKLNRYYTEEFFDLAGHRLLDGGILSISHSSSENFISVEQSRVLRSLRRSLAKAFENVTLLPGDTVYFLAGPKVVSTDAMIGRISERGIEARYITKEYLAHRLSGERIDFLLSSVEARNGVMENSDALPALTSYELLLEFSREGLTEEAKIGWILLRKRWYFISAIALVLILIFACSGSEKAAKLDVWSVGSAGFLFQISVLLSYQSFSGYLYNGIVLLTALFMAGVSSGTLFAIKWSKSRFLNPFLTHILFILLTMLNLLWVRAESGSRIGFAAASALFYAASFGGGFLTGIFYRSVVSSVLEKLEGSEPAVFYAWDMFGACVGGLLGGVVLYPLSGMTGLSGFVIFMHAAGIFLLTARWKSYF